MKKNFIILFLGLVLLPTITLASPTKLGRFYDFISSPSYTATKADRTAYIQWAKNNFDLHNIPLMSSKNVYENGKLVGVDSTMKYNPLEMTGRFYAWIAYTGEWNPDKTVRYYNEPELVYNPYYMRDAVAYGSPKGVINLVGNGIPQALPDIKRILDSTEEADGDHSAAVPLTVASYFNEGSIAGNVSYKIEPTAIAYFHKNALGFFPGNSNAQTYVTFQVILAEGYHNYGTEEHYFIPRRYLYTGVNLGGAMTTIDAMKQGNINFDFPIDKSWNTKYLYVIALAELFPLPYWNPTTGVYNTDSIPNINWRFLLDASIDRVVDVKNPSTHTPIKLELDYVNAAQKCQIVPAGTSNVPINIKVTNPTPNIVKAIAYIDKNTSHLNDWNFTKGGKDTIVVPAGGSITVTLTGKAPTNGAAAIDFAVLPVDVKANENPIISNILALAATDSIKILALINDSTSLNNFYIAFASGNSYYENISCIPAKYYSVVDVDMFSAYFYSHTSLSKCGSFEPSFPYVSAWSVPGNLLDGATKEQELAISDVMDINVVKFLNSVISKNKYIALFTDRSGAYSALSSIPADLKTEYQTLFNNFGVSFKEELSRRDGIAPIAFQLNGFAEPLAQIKDKPISVTVNSSSLTNMPNYQYAIANWTVTNSVRTSKILYYDNAPSTVAAVAYEQGATTKRFLSGCGFGACFAMDMTSQVATFLDNITTWWFGKQVKLTPKIETPTTNINFGLVDLENNDTAKWMKIPISNIATDPVNILKIYSATGLVDNYDESFTVMKDLKSELQAGETDTLIIKFYPKATLDYNVVYRIISNDPVNGTFNLYLTAKGNMVSAKIPNLVLSTPADEFHNFGTVDSGTAIKRKEYFLYNNGNAQSNITSITLSTETDKDIFSLRPQEINDLTNDGLSAGEERSFELRMSPVKVGTFEGKIIINCNNPDKPTIELEFYVEIDPIISIAEEVAKIFNCNISPNPVSDVATIDFNVIGELSRNVLLNIVDNSGRVVETIFNRQYAPGNYKEKIDISKLASGVYYIEYTVDDKKSATSITIVK